MLFGCCIRHPEEVPQVQCAGYDFYEFSGSEIAEMSDDLFDKLCMLTEKHRLPCIGFNSYSSGTPAIVGEHFSPDASHAYAQLLCQRGQRLGIRNLGIGAPKARQLPPDFPRAKADEQCISFLQITCDVAKEFGISVLLEAVHSRSCNYLNTTQEATEMISRVERENLKLVLDFYHMHVMGESLSSVRDAAPFLSHVHVSTCGEDLYRGFPQVDEILTYRRIFQSLQEIGYNRTVSIEPAAFQPEGAASSVKMLRSLCP